MEQTIARRIILFAHSMGAQVAVEALRQMANKGKVAHLERLHAVILASPDIDLDLFRAEVQTFDRFDVPVYIFVSTHDKALHLSSRLRGGGQPAPW